MKFPDASFAPFFDELVVVSGTRPGTPPSSDAKTFRCTCRACVMPLADAAAVLDDSVQATRPRFSVLVPSRGDRAWIEAALGTRPQTGDAIELANGLKATVRKVNPLVDAWYEMEAEA